MGNINISQYIAKAQKPFILDGAMGSLLEQRGYHLDEILWTSLINLTDPDTIIKLHKEYIQAGCDIITSNTFRTNPATVKLSNKIIDSDDFVKQSVRLSKSVANKYNVLLAGSNPPSEDCYQKNRTLLKKELELNHQKHIYSLYDSGADFILNETQSHWDEIEIISKYCTKLSIPYAISIFYDSDLNILSGQSLSEVINMIRSYNPILISFNCISQNIFRKSINTIKLDFDWGFYLNCGQINNLTESIKCDLDPQSYIEIIKSSLNLSPKLIGACCGSNPMHIKKINDLIYEKTNS